MITSQWDLGLVIAGFVLNAALLYFTYRYARQSVPAAASGGTTLDGELGAGDEDDVVECRHCGAENDPGYRFCRACVSELPGVTSYGRAGSGQAGRASL